MSRSLDWRWIGIGIAIMFGLSFVAGLLAVGMLGGTDAVTANAAAGSTSVGGGRLLLVSLLSFAAFLAGGYIVALKSPGRTILEPGISAAIAVALTLLVGGVFSLGTLLGAGLIPFVAGLFGGWLGERAQEQRPTP